MQQSHQIEVLVLGGGYAGIVTALRLSRKTDPGKVRVTLINGQEYFVERIRLHQQAANQALTHHSYVKLLASTPISSMSISTRLSKPFRIKETFKTNQRAWQHGICSGRWNSYPIRICAERLAWMFWLILTRFANSLKKKIYSW